MARKWGEIRKQLSPEPEARIAANIKTELARLSLSQLREAHNLTQENLAQVLDVAQGAVSRMEKRTDMYISTLRSYLRAMGGNLEIKARFSDGSEVVIDQFEDIKHRRTRNRHTHDHRRAIA